ncbi:MAG: hypothetical protein ACF8XB_17215, partial [Planctomycetota bacterium JB042]
VLSRYVRGRALVLAGRLGPAREAALEFERRAGEDAFRLRYAADLWNELVLALRRAGAGPDAEREATGRMYRLLGRAVDAGYADREELTTTPSLSTFRDDREYRALLERLPRGA